jgi:predicted DNA binding CopG/RHH family protein
MPRASADLVLITIRLRREDVAYARAEAKRRTVPYQHVIRGWVADAVDAAKRKA